MPAPGDHDSRDPAPRPHASENQVTRDFTKRVANEEDPSAKAVNRGAEAEVAIHLECRKADIHSVQETYDVKNEQKGDQPPGHGAYC